MVRGWLATVAMGLGLAGPAMAQGVVRELEGHWTLNLQRSDRLADKFPDEPGLFGGQIMGQPIPPGRDPPEGGDRDGQGERGERGGRGSGPGGRTRFAGMPDLALRMEARQPSRELRIELTDTSATITDDEGRSQLVPTNGRRLEEVTGGGRKLRTEARWKDGDLRVQKQVSGIGTALRATYRYDRLTGRMTLLLLLETGRREPIEIRLVYDRAEPGDPPS